MSDARNSPAKRPRHSMADWLALHDLDPARCALILSASAQFNPVAELMRDAVPATPEINADAAWQLAAQSLATGFSGAKAIIETARQKTGTDFRSDPQRRASAYTLNDGGNGFPFVVCSYRGGVGDILTIAHEFSHAVQIIASDGRFVAPVVRETCAFVGEQALLSLLRSTGSDLFAGVQTAWLADHHRYFNTYQKVLQAALSTPKAPYSYRWNYPVARRLAIEAERQLADTEIWPLFEGRTSLTSFCDLLAF